MNKYKTACKLFTVRQCHFLPKEVPSFIITMAKSKMGTPTKINTQIDKYAWEYKYLLKRNSN